MDETMLRRLLREKTQEEQEVYVSLLGKKVSIATPRLENQAQWLQIRSLSKDFLVPWEPKWPEDALTNVGYRARLKYFLRDWRHGNGYPFFVHALHDQRLVGGISLNNVRYGSCLSASVGYWMGKPYARHGYTFDALSLVLRFAFVNLRLNRIEAACMPANKPSCQLLLKAGFHFEGVARKYLQINDVWQDHMIFSRLRSDPGVMSAPRVLKS